LRTDGLYTESVSDWDAARYHRVSDPQWSWGLRVLDRLAPAAGERILDVGCGTGRLTAEIAVRAPAASVTGIDLSPTMLLEARRRSRGPALVRADAARLPFTGGFDAVFSTATFHWVPDHATLFAEIHRVLAARGRLVAQAGGGPNLARLYARAEQLAHASYAPAFRDWRDPWTFAGVDDTRTRLAAAGFVASDVWLEAAPTPFDSAASFADFVSTVCLRHHLVRLPAGDRDLFVERLTTAAASDDPPFTLDYWRLNIDARKG
jgi:trans-aconitate 2-methyltransferase